MEKIIEVEINTKAYTKGVEVITQWRDETMMVLMVSNQEYDDFRLYCVEHGYKVEDRVRQMMAEASAT